ncbi:hypothetical protein H920_04841 [Fukomys damarensis]|uniref:Uncharacterized protein n=1 Tax=Fukomys damarensis TaxID=885580 RepID=A0A091DRX9_FUKDA|nr:hypothetical protein H920_04841 [Fukomys damarensis]
MRKNSGVITNFPITHIFTLRRLLMLLPRRIMMAEEKGACYTILVTIPALWLDLINAQDLDTLSLAMSCTFAKGAFPMNVPPFKMVGSATYLPVSIVEAKAAGSPKSQAVPRDHLPSTPVPTPCLQRQRLTRTTGDTGTLGFSLISSRKQFPPR